MREQKYVYLVAVAPVQPGGAGKAKVLECF